MHRGLLYLLLFFWTGTSYGQEVVFVYSDKGLAPLQFGLYGDDEGNLFIHYVQRPEHTSTYQSNFIFGKSGKRATLPFTVTVYGVGYTKDRFLLCTMRRNSNREVLQSALTLLKFDKRGNGSPQNTEVSIQGEDDPFIFDDHGLIYALSMVKKTGVFRIRRFSDLYPETFDFVIDKERKEFWGNKAVFLSRETEPDYLALGSQRKVFFRNGKLVIIHQVPGDSGKGALSVYEFNLTSPSSYHVRDVIEAPTTSFVYYPFEENLFLYQAGVQAARIGVIDFGTLKVVKTYAAEGANQDLLNGEVVRAGVLGRNVEVKMEANGIAAKYKRVSRGKPWVQAWPSNESMSRVTFGDQTMIGVYHEYTYFSFLLNKTSFEMTPGEPDNSHRQQLVSYAFNERKGKLDDYGFFFAKGATYLVGIDRKTNSFTVWK